MKRANTAVAKQGISLRTMMMMVPVIAGLSNPSLITQAADALQTGVETTATAFAPDIAGYATGIVQSAASHGAMHTSMSSPVYISGGPIYMPYNS
jgi:hypothetical protein